MLVSPLLSQELVERVLLLVQRGDARDEIIQMLAPLSVEEKLHVVRFLYWNDLGNSETLLSVWETFIAEDHILNTAENRQALYEIGRWWDAFGESHAMSGRSYDDLENHLDALGATLQGKEYFRWVALYPAGRNAKIGKCLIWEDERRGAIICLAKYACSREIELFLARHLDDWNTIQMEVIAILAALKSRLLPKLASWYMKDDSQLKLYLEEYGFDEDDNG